jgi:hypothetical protein
VAVHLLDAGTGKELRVFETGEGVLGAATSADGKRLLAYSSSREWVWNGTTGEELWAPPAPEKDPGQPVAALAPDGKTVAVARGTGFRAWDVASGTVLGDLPLHESAVTALAFSPDGKVLATASTDRTTLLWDWAAVRQRLAASPKHETQTPVELWQALAGNNGNAQEALWALTVTPGPTVAFLKANLKPVPPVAPARLKKLLDDLDSKQFAVREQATKELEALADLAAAALDERLAGKASLEAQRRLEALREKLDGPPPPPLLRALRAVEVLEHIATPEARQLLAALAAGAPGHRLTAEAAASVQRLKQRADLP